MFVIISGCSGSGKNTIMNEIMQKDNSIAFLRSCTSREVRDVGGNSKSQYIHLTREEFLSKIKNGDFLEYEEIHGNFYGILNSSIDELSDYNKCYIKDVGVLGKKSLEEKIGNKTKIVSIFIDVPKNLIKERLIARGEKEVDLRMSRIEMEESCKDDYKYVVKNIDLETAVSDIEKIIKAERN